MLWNVVQNYFECYIDNRVLAQIKELFVKKSIIYYKELFLRCEKLKYDLEYEYRLKVAKEIL